MKIENKTKNHSKNFKDLGKRRIKSSGKIKLPNIWTILSILFVLISTVNGLNVNNHNNHLNRRKVKPSTESELAADLSYKLQN